MGKGVGSLLATQLADLMLHDEILLRSMKFDEKAWVEGPFFLEYVGRGERCEEKGP